MVLNNLLSILEQEKYITNDMALNVINMVKEGKGSIVDIIIQEDILEFEILANVICRYFNIQTYCEEAEASQKEALSLICFETAKKYNALPIKVENKKLYVAFSDPTKTKDYEDLEWITKHKIVPLFGRKNLIELKINLYYGNNKIKSLEDEFKNKSQVKKEKVVLQNEIESAVDHSPVVKLINSIIEAAVIRLASDIHIEPLEKNIRVRLRVDGHLIEYDILDLQMGATILSRIKVMADMDISEKRLPQDGHFNIDNLSQPIDFRVSTIATIYGEKAAIRLIYRKNNSFQKNDLGFLEEDLDTLTKLFRKSHGAILLTGPTGSGKTTTLSVLLRELNKIDKNITTIEEPVENILEGANQININPKAGLDYGNVLRFVLRQDPDIIMIGEIRDSETAVLAIRAAMTGHLVLSTLHTNDAISTIVRLVDMGVQDYLVYSAVKGVISQRLVRRICQHCKSEYIISKEDSIALNIPEDTVVYQGKGCVHCDFTGYKGRFAIYEIFVMNDDVLRMFIEKKPTWEINEYLKEIGMKSIWDCGVRNIKLGNTTISEVYEAILS